MKTRRIHYVTFGQLIEDTLSLIAKIPSHITAVAGVPRSGMFPASMIATILHLPLFAATPHGLVKLGHGRRLAERTYGVSNCLVIDDSANRGGSMARAVEALGLPRGHIVTAVVYAHPWCLRHSGGGIDIAERVLPSLRLFEWNLLNRPMASKMMCDIDGVICRNPKVPDDDGDAGGETSKTILG